MRTKFYGSVKVLEPETDRIAEALRDFVQDLAAKPEVSAILLIGSFHRKDFGPFSDIDLVLILDSTKIPFLDRSLQYLPESFPVAIDLFVYTRQEVDEMKLSGHPFWSDIEKNHTILFERK